MKTKVLDTNIILEHSLRNIIEKLDKEDDKVEIVIPFSVTMELDTFKKGLENKNFYARESLRLLEDLRKKARREESKLSDGIMVTENCSLLIYVTEEDLKLDLNKVDNDIILTAHLLDNERDNVELYTLDFHERIIADCFGIESDGLEEEVEVGKLYTGIAEIPITDDQLQEMNTDFHDRSFKTTRKLLNNQFTAMTDGTKTKHYGRYCLETKSIRALKPNYEAWKIRPKTTEQSMFMDLLLDKSVEFVSAIGPSGTGKTLVTLACALEQTIETNLYSKIVVMRPLVSLDRDLGALPGDKFEKLEPWMGSTFDSLEFLLEKKSAKGGCSEPYFHSREKVYDLIDSGLIELEAMQFIRGRSIPNQFIIVDDAQNLTPHQAATIITRAGEGSKVVFLGDISKQQIDNPRLNSSNNGLTYIVDKLKGQDPIIGHVTFNKVVRSRLASLGVDLL